MDMATDPEDKALKSSVICGVSLLLGARQPNRLPVPLLFRPLSFSRKGFILLRALSII